ncbi:MAG: M15 family metallopeptidase [Clostridia bacterium]|nr:M15 family metallopeptidase [Clostridia bacterium]
MINFKKILCAILAVCLIFALSGCVIKGNEEVKNTTKASSQRNTITTTEATTTTSTTVTSATPTATTTKKKVTTTTATTVYRYPYAYAGFNPTETDMSVKFNKILLNRDHALPDGYVPKLAEAVKGSGVKLDYRVAPYYQKMYDAALADGITLEPISGYRSFERQKRNFENEIKLYENKGFNKKDATVKASQVVLLPGTSEHNAGLAMDICSLSVDFENTKEFAWLQAHAHEYGFIMRYPKDKTEITKITYEPWHYRFVGVDIATELKQSGMVLEEYLS